MRTQNDGEDRSDDGDDEHRRARIRRLPPGEDERQRPQQVELLLNGQ